MSTIIDNFIAPPCHDEIDVLWQDEHLLLINKPAGLLATCREKIRRTSTLFIIGWCRIFLAVLWFIAWISALPG